MVKSHKLADLLVQQQAVVVEESDVAAGGVGADAGGGEGLRQLLLEETKCHGASERPGKPLRTKSARTNTSSNTE